MTWGTKNFAVPILKEPRRLVSGSLIVLFLLISSTTLAFSQTPTTTPEVTLSPTIESFSFVVFGDNRDGDKVFQDLISKVKQEKDIAFAVNTGDFVSHGLKSEYKTYLRMANKLKAKIYHVPGNHDLISFGHRYFNKYFGPLYYSFDYNNSHFVVLNNAFKRYFDAKQFRWLKEDLAKTDKENIFVFMHRPTFDPSDIYKSHVMSGRETVKQLMKVFKKYKVDYVIAGHIHGYAKTKRDGVVYIVTGGGGAPLHLPKDFGGFYHYVKIKVDGDKIGDEVVKIYE